MEEQKAILKQVFGGESSDDEEQQQPIIEISVHNCGSRSPIDSDSNPSWEPIIQINGLWLCTDFLSSHQHSTLLSHIQNEGRFTESSNNQAIRFGDLPFWAIELSDSIREAVLFGDQISQSAKLGSSECGGGKGTCLLPSDLLWREPVFDQLIVNVYQPGEGICALVDLMRFEDGIAIISLESSCVMHFTQARAADDNGKEENDQDIVKGDLLFYYGERLAIAGSTRLIASQGFKYGKGRN